MSLAERIEAATGPDRELDAAIDALLGWSPVPNPTMAGGLIDMMHGPGGVTVRRNTPAYTGSIDAAMMLVAGLEGRSVWQVRTMLDHACYNAIKPRSTAADLAKDLPRYIAAAAIRSQP